MTFITFGLIGWCMEVFWTGLGSLIRKDFRATSTTSIWMFFIYGSALFLEPVYDLLAPYPLIIRGCVYVVCIFAAEYLSGMALRRARICPWDYSGSAYSIHGVISLSFAPAWFTAGLVFEAIYKFLTF